MSQTLYPIENPAAPQADEPAALLNRIAEMQAQLDFLREQLTESQRLATIGTISAVIAHEFNNILTPVVSYAQYALQSFNSDKPDQVLIKKALTKSFQGSEKAGRICTSLLALARGESTAERVSVQKLVDEALLVLARDPQKDGIALRVQVQPDLMLDVDAVQLEQVLLNLLINARQAMHGTRGGSITIRGHEVEGAGEMRLQVIDTGPGIPDRVLPRIFEPFFTTKSAAKKGESRGTGLGLAICKEIIEHHGGRIEVSSEVGKGTTFSLYLPAARAA